MRYSNDNDGSRSVRMASSTRIFSSLGNARISETNLSALVAIS